jgi:glycerophosphoryl diester phosphodiesterase
MKRHLFALSAALLALAVGQPASSRADESVRLGKPLVHAHSHNDYEHKRPLFDALAQGFCGVEADIHLKDGSLLVGHDASSLTPDRTLQKLYLDPLRKLVEVNHGRVYPGGPSVMLLIDMKTDGASTYAVLEPVLKEYAPMLTRFENGKIITNAITVVISGNRPRAALLNESDRLASYDGRLSDLKNGAELSTAFMPLVSDAFRQRFPSAKKGALSDADRKAFREAIQMAHAQGRRIRFWDTKDDPETWAMLLSEGVDFINSDRLQALAAFLNSRHSQ